MRRIGVLIPGTANDSEFQTRLGAFLQALALLGWDIGRNVSIDTRWATSNTAEVDRHARELAALAPDVILANGSAAAAPLLQATRTVPIVFAIAADPVGAGLVDSLARPGGNATGFITFEYGISAKWLELLKEIAPGVKQVAVFRDPDLALGAGQFGAMQSAAPSFGVEVRPVDVRDAPAIERADHRLREHCEWRFDRDWERGSGCASRVDRQAGGPAQAARRLCRPLLPRRRRPDVLWA